MSNAIARISDALGYDAAESMLAAGLSLASVLAFAATAAESTDVVEEPCPVSFAPTMHAVTTRPGCR